MGDNQFAQAAAAAAARMPMASNLVPISDDRYLLVDGDGLAYYCAGSTGTSLAEARENLRLKISKAAQVVGVGHDKVIVLLTAEGSDKGGRYAIARVKPYQAQRSGSRRPENWRGLRDYMDDSNRFPFAVYDTRTAEADDLFAYYSDHFGWDKVVIYTQDKDMRMVPGTHLDWVEHSMHVVKPGENSVAGGKQYGMRWFWLQMLHGDTADNIPGLPLCTMKYGGGPVDKECKLNKVGEAGAAKLLAAYPDEHPMYATTLAYHSYYGERWLVEMLEQACLLWMRRKPQLWDDCLASYGPLAPFRTASEFEAAYNEIAERVRQAKEINELSSQTI